jgi:hypothetical protein
MIRYPQHGGDRAKANSKLNGDGTLLAGGEKKITGKGKP